MRRIALFALGILGVLSACDNSVQVAPDAGFITGPPGDGGTIDSGPPSERIFFDDFHPTPLDLRGSYRLDPVDVVECRAPQRLSVDHLRRSLPYALAGSTWDVGIPPVEGLNVLEILARTLGEADYITTTSDDREPNPLFMKFMDNMASKVCINAVIHDWAAALPPQDRVLRRYDDAEENLRYLRLKFHSVYVPPGTQEGIAELLQLYNDLEALDPYPELGDPEIFKWYGVCVAVITAPEFFAY